MMRDTSERPHLVRRSVNRVSSAVWPASMRRVIATGKAAQRRRDWLMQRRWLVLLVDALSLRAIFMVTTLLVVGSSLLVAVLGLSFWYLLLVPLLLFALMALLPAFLVSKAPVEAPPASLATFAQGFKSSMGQLSFPSQDMQSVPGYFQELPHSSAQLEVGASSLATPVRTEPPLVRVLETYDLRETHVRHFFEEMLRSETGEHSAIRHQRLSQDFWNSAVCPTTLNASPTELDKMDVPPSASGNERDL